MKNAKMIDALLGCKQYIKPAHTHPCVSKNTSQHICIALAMYAPNSKHQIRLEDMISDRISPYYTLESWVLANVPDARTMSTPDFSQAMYEYRLEWIDNLIRELASQ